MKVSITGSRWITLGAQTIQQLLDMHGIDDIDIEQVVTGDAMGVDWSAQRYARAMDKDYKLFYANWDKYGKGAGPKRNQEIVDSLDPATDKALVIWDGRSPGSRDMQYKLAGAGIKTYVYRLELQGVLN